VLTEHILHRLKTRLNCGTTINRLPPEILLRVFEIPQQEIINVFTYFPPSFSRRTALHVAPLLHITAVCQHWRNLALSSRSLWKCWQVPHFTVRSMSLAQEIFCRSSPLPFCFQVGKSTGILAKEATTQYTALLEKARERVQALHIQSYGPLEHLTDSLPNLTSLHIEDIGGRYITLFLDNPHFLNLKRCSLKDFYSIPEMPIATLTHLSLANEVWRSGLEEFLDFLGGFPLLEELHLHDVGPVINEPLPEASLQKVPLNALRLFNMQGYESDRYPLQLLHHLHTPSLMITRWEHRFTINRREYRFIADDMVQWAIPPCQLLQNLTCMIIRVGTADLCEVREDTIYLEATTYGGFYAPPWLPHFLPEVQSLVITWKNIMHSCGGLLGTFSTLSTLECHLDSAIDLFLELEKVDNPWLPNLTELALWYDPLEVDPDEDINYVLATLGEFSWELGSALSNSRVAIRERNASAASTFTVRLELGDIDRWKGPNARTLLAEWDPSPRSP